MGGGRAAGAHERLKVGRAAQAQHCVFHSTGNAQNCAEKEGQETLAPSTNATKESNGQQGGKPPPKDQATAVQVRSIPRQQGSSSRHAVKQLRHKKSQIFKARAMCWGTKCHRLRFPMPHLCEAPGRQRRRQRRPRGRLGAAATSTGRRHGTFSPSVWWCLVDGWMNNFPSCPIFIRPKV